MELRPWGPRAPVQDEGAVASQNFAVGWGPWALVSPLRRTLHVHCTGRHQSPWTPFLHPQLTLLHAPGHLVTPMGFRVPASLPLKYQLPNCQLSST